MSENQGGAGRPGGPGPGGAADPFAAWRSMYQMGEESWSAMLDQMIGTQSFSKVMGQALENYLKAQQVAQKNFEGNLSAMNVPTKSDLTRIAGQIVALDAKVDDLQFVVEELRDSLKQLAERGPDSIRQELARLASIVESTAVQDSGIQVGETDAAPTASESADSSSVDAATATAARRSSSGRGRVKQDPQTQGDA